MTKKKIHRKLIIAIVFIVSTILILYLIKVVVLKTSCPDAMIDNRMPMIPVTCSDEGCEQDETRYYIKNNERKDFYEYNYLWARYFCGVKPEVVY